MKSCTKPKKLEGDSTNATTDEVQDALILAVQSPIDDWILDSGASFHCTPHHEMMQNYVAGDPARCSLSGRWTTNGYCGYRRCANQDNE